MALCDSQCSPCIFHGSAQGYDIHPSPEPVLSNAHIYLFVLGATAPPKWARAPSFKKFLDHTQRRTSQYDSSGRVISSLQRPLSDNRQHSQQKNIYDNDGIRTHNLNRRAAVDLRLRPRGHWDRRMPM